MPEAKAGFRSLTGAIDTTIPAGRMMKRMVGASAEFERSMLKERTKAGHDPASGEAADNPFYLLHIPPASCGAMADAAA